MLKYRYDINKFECCVNFKQLEMFGLYNYILLYDVNVLIAIKKKLDIDKKK